MKIETKYSPGDKVYVILSPSMRGGGHGWICQKATIYFIKVFCDDNRIKIEYTFKESVDSRHEIGRASCRERV
jgi:hypothetical protein